MSISTMPAGIFEALPPRFEPRAKDYFAYGIDLLDVGAGESDSGTFQVQADSDFLWAMGTVRVNENGTPETRIESPGMTVRIESSGSGRNLQDRALPLSSVFGTAQRPFVLPYPKLMDASSVIRATVNNLEAARDLDVRLAFHGFKVFYSEWGI